MAKIHKELPANRADYTFGDLIYWHLFVFGTRPNVHPQAKVGRPWKLDRASTALGRTDKTLRNWCKNESLPTDITDLCDLLFGDSAAWDDARLELLESLARARKGRKGTVPTSADDVASSPSDGGFTSVDTEKGAGAGQGEADTSQSSGDASGPEHPAREEEENRPPNAGGSRELVHLRPIQLRAKSYDHPKHGRKRAAVSMVAGLSIFFGLYAWVTSGRNPRPPVTPPPHVAIAPPVEKPAPPAPRAAETPSPPVLPTPPPVTVLPKPEPEITPPKPRELTPEERKRAEDERLERERMEARRRAHDREKEEQEAEALRRDRENDGRARDLAQREDDARTAAGLNYRIQEHRRIQGSSYRHVLAATVGDCANACTADPSCDAFGFYREQYGPESKRKRVCYFFRKPFDPPAGHSGYVHGEPIEPRRGADLREPSGDEELLVRVQAKKPEPKADEGLTRCATGPVKVTGFKLTCDQMLGGGTTLGSTRLSYTVANINECASKCRPVKQCVGFAFNASDREGQHYCIIFGPTPESRESKGWISGVR